MKKRFLDRAAAFVVVFALTVIFFDMPLCVPKNCVYAVETPESDFSFTENSDGTLTITKYNGSETDIIFPSVINGKAVMKIGSGGYYDSVIPDFVTSVVIPEGVKDIDDFAFAIFSNYSHIKSIKFPDSLLSIGDYVFWGSEALSSVRIPPNVNEIGRDVFMYCYSLEYIDVDANNQYYCSENGILYNKEKTVLEKYPEGKSDTEYTVPSTVKTIKGNSLFNCKDLRRINISEGTESIGINAFWAMRDLETVTIPSTITNVDGTYLSYMTNTVVICDENVDQSLIGDAQSVINFRTENGEVKITDYRGIKTNIEIPAEVNGVTVTTIGSGAFDNTGITSVDIPDTVQNIESGAFSGCTDLGTVIYSESINVADGAFPNETVQLSYTLTPDGGVTVEVVADGGRDSIEIPDSIGGAPVTNINTGNTGVTVEHTHSGGTATCTQKAVCDICGQGYGDVDVLNHDFPTDWTETITPTCTSKGKEIKVCQRQGCNEAQERETNALGHDFPTDWTETIAPTCISKGKEIKVCQRQGCNETQERETNALGHDFPADWTETTAPTCTNNGKETRTCQRQGCNETQEQEINALGHDFGEWAIIQAAFCTENGIKERMCKRTGCNEKETEEIGMLGHDYSQIRYDESGHWKECSRCGDKADTENHISDGGTVTKESTETAEGERTYKCTKCGYVIRTESIPKKAAVPVVPAPVYPVYNTPSSPSFSTEPVTTSGKSHTRQKLTLKAETTPNSIKLSWSKISGAKKYTVYIYRNGRYEKLKDTAGTSFVFKKPVHGKTYRFLVRYSANGRLSAEMFSGKVTVTVYLKPVVTAYSDRNSIKLSWKPVSGAEKYAVYRYKNGRGSKIYETENTYAVIKNLKSGAKYSYVVRAYVGGKWTPMTRSDIVTATAE